MPLCLVYMPIRKYLHAQTELVPVVSVMYNYVLIMDDSQKNQVLFLHK